MTHGGLSIRGVTKSYGAERVFENFTLDFAPGECVLLLGANGAGKTTLLKLLAGLARPERGEAGVSGATGRLEPIAAADLGCAGHALMLYGHLTVAENLELFRALVPPAHALDEALERWNLKSLAHRPVRELSKGEQTRVSLCRALAHEPRYTLLDEPSAPLDERALALFTTELSRIRERHAESAVTVIATHDLARLLPLASRIVILEHGAVRYDSRAQHPGLSIAEIRQASIQFYLEANR